MRSVLSRLLSLSISPSASIQEPIGSELLIFLGALVWSFVPRSEVTSTNHFLPLYCLCSLEFSHACISITNSSLALQVRRTCYMVASADLCLLQLLIGLGRDWQKWLCLQLPSVDGHCDKGRAVLPPRRRQERNGGHRHA